MKTKRFEFQENLMQSFNELVLAGDKENAVATAHAMSTWLDDIREGDFFTKQKIDDCFSAITEKGWFL